MLTTAANRYWLALALFVILALAFVKTVHASFISQDDAFFLDAGRNLLDHRTLSLSIWGNVLRHEDFLASYPPLVPALAAIDLWLVRMTGDPLFVKASGVLLLLLSAVVFWYCLSFIKTPWIRCLAVLAVFIDPLAMTFFFTLRPEALLILVMLLLYVAALRLVDGWSPTAFIAVNVVSILGALAHWQFLPLLLFVGLTMAWLASRRRLPLWALAIYAAAVGAVYAAYGYVIVSSPARTEAFRSQMGQIAGTTGLWAKLKFLGGNILASNVEMGSAYSVCLIWLLLLLLWKMFDWLWGRRRHEARPADVFAVAFVAVAIAPSLYLDYVGPRMVPLYLVVLLLLLAHAESARDIWAFSLAGVVAATINYIGHVGLEYTYFRARGIGPLIGTSLVWLSLAIAVLFLSRRLSAVALAGLTLGAALVVSLALYVQAQRHQVFHVTRSNQAALGENLWRQRLEGESVLSDLSVHYLPLEETVSTARIYTIFPVLYFNSNDYFRKFMASVKPTVVLLTPAMYRSMAQSPPNGTALLDTLRSAFVARDSFVVTGVKTWVLKRR
jgi:hypothetical protein